MSGSYVRLEHDAGVVRVTITRADKLNALDREVLQQLGAALGEAQQLTDARCLILTQPLYRGSWLGQYQANVLKAVQRGPSGKRDHPDCECSDHWIAYIFDPCLLRIVLGDHRQRCKCSGDIVSAAAVFEAGDTTHPPGVISFIFGAAWRSSTWLPLCEDNS